MRPFEYVTATSIETARQLLGANGHYLAGGNDLLGRLKDDITEAVRLVNIKGIGALRHIEPGPDRWQIGALVTIAEIEDHAELRKIFPGLQQAAAEVGSQQIRNVATLGGNLAQHSRCWYYRHRDIQCLKKRGRICYALEGDNRYHALFTGNVCISPVVSNLAIALTALDATAVIWRDGQERRLTMAELYELAWDNPTAHHSLRPGDLLLRVEIPTKRPRSAYLQVSEKHSFDWALVSCAAAARLENGRIYDARVALGCISPVPHQVAAANQFLEGKPLERDVAEKAADLLLTGAEPHEHNAYKIPMARALIRRTLLQLGT
ncbi:MAG: FAD binding domain-containing protein [Verrucomicrobiota bacterium]|nr:FAD binding domain-containing protein [Limisphaera sp.]MDW8381744.1 FAD binding domain-containing protein [Verrucomicrobiota bacterium]